MTVKAHPNAKITEGEIYGAPVPGGWPDRGPFQVLGHALRRVFSRRSGKSRVGEQRPPEGGGPGSSSAQPRRESAE